MALNYIKHNHYDLENEASHFVPEEKILAGGGTKERKKAGDCCWCRCVGVGKLCNGKTGD